MVVARSAQPLETGQIDRLDPHRPPIGLTDIGVGGIGLYEHRRHVSGALQMKDNHRRQTLSGAPLTAPDLNYRMHPW